MLTARLSLCCSADCSHAQQCLKAWCLTEQQVIGVKGREIEVIFKVVAGILHLGNVEFAPARVGAADGSTIRNPDSLQWAATVLGVDPALLTKELCQKKFHTRTAGGGVRR